MRREICVKLTPRLVEFVRLCMQDYADVSESASIRRDAILVVRRLDAAIQTIK